MKEKTEKQVLDQIYVNMNDLLIIFPGTGIDFRRGLIMEIRKEMEEQGYFVPPGKPRLARTDFLKKKIGL